MRAAFVTALALAAPVSAQDFAAGSEAASWGLLGEAPARFQAEVVDIACELSGDCPPDCGGGGRQIGLLRTADDKLILPMKNGQPVFSGAVADLAPYCGQTVEVDGLMVGEAEYTSAPFYMVQRLRPAGATDFLPADQFTETWAEAHPDAAPGDWFRADPEVNARIAKDGYLGLGLEIDKAFIEEWF